MLQSTVHYNHIHIHKYFCTVPFTCISWLIRKYCGSGSAFIQVMACCLAAPSHWLNEYWLVIYKVWGYSHKGSGTLVTLFNGGPNVSYVKITGLKPETTIHYTFYNSLSLILGHLYQKYVKSFGSFCCSKQVCDLISIPHYFEKQRIKITQCLALLRNRSLAVEKCTSTSTISIWQSFWKRKLYTIRLTLLLCVSGRRV